MRRVPTCVRLRPAMFGLAALSFSTAWAAQSSRPGAAAEARSPAQQQVIEQLHAQPIGEHTIADLDLPEEYLRRLADRIIRESYEQRFRIVVRDQGAAEAGPAFARGPESRHDEPGTMHRPSAADPAPGFTDNEAAAARPRRAPAWLPMVTAVVVILAVGLIMARRKGAATQ